MILEIGRSYFSFFSIEILHLVGLPNALSFSQILPLPPKKSRTVVQNEKLQCWQGLTRHFLFYWVGFVLLFCGTNFFSSPLCIAEVFQNLTSSFFEPSAKFFRIDTRSLNKTPAMTGSLNKGLAHATRARKYNWFHIGAKKPAWREPCGFQPSLGFPLS